MTDPEWETLVTYIRDRRDDLRLHAWDITVKKEPPEDEKAYSSTFIENESNTAKMRFCHDFRELPAELQRETVIHELLHCYLDRLANQADDWIEHGYSKAAYDAIHVTFGHDYERVTDAIAMAIADKYPLIKWPK